MKDISRRRFLKYLGAGTIGLIATPKIPFTTKINGSRASDVIQCFDENATLGSTINESVVQIMMDESIKSLTGINNVGEAWKSIFPGIIENNIISVKVNPINSSLSTHPEFVNCIVNGITQMNFGAQNFIRNNIIIWDRTDGELSSSGYTIYDGSDPDTVRCFGTNHGGVGYDTTKLNVNGVTSYPSRILSIMSDYLINVPVLKTLSISTLTLNLKNHYGSINNPGSLHGIQCNPYIPSLNQQIRDIIVPNNIQKIFIIDALFGRYYSSLNFNPKMLIMSHDTVACDYQGQNVINEERVAQGYSTINAPHITTAAQPPYSLGTTDVNLIEINNPSNIEESKTTKPGDGFLKITPNPFRRRTLIILSLEHNSAVHLDLINSTGRTAAKIYSGQLTKGTHRIDYSINKKLGSGTYFIRFYNQGKTRIQKVMILN
ncbi:DUF362 domain-containing protein [candidate division WOR-3 bacterium]|nr:DUF362 domain-containing protein [candidate division WOR-3 bacterium]